MLFKLFTSPFISFLEFLAQCGAVKNVGVGVILPKSLHSPSKLSEKNMRKIELKVSDEVKISVIVCDNFSMLELPGLGCKMSLLLYLI